MTYVCSANDKFGCESDVNLVEQILEQGQKLRNSMLETILKTDPLYDNNVIKCSEQEKKMHAINMDQQTQNDEISTSEKHKFVAYLRGDSMSQNDEKQVLDTFRTLSVSDICEITERPYSTLQNTCNCETCKIHSKHDFLLSSNNIEPLFKLGANDFKSNLNLKLGTLINKPHQFSYLKYIDSLKIVVHNLKLNPQGNMKVSSSFSKIRPKYPENLSTVYYIEYNIPSCLIKTVSKKLSTQCDELNRTTKLCSKKIQNEGIYFKHVSIHNISNVDAVNLDEVDIKFQISCRTLKQKNQNIIGFAKLNFGLLKKSKYLSCNQELVVFLKNDIPIVLGTLKVGLQLGCGRIYFGKEFLDSLNANIENKILTDQFEENEYFDPILSSKTDSLPFEDDDLSCRTKQSLPKLNKKEEILESSKKKLSPICLNTPISIPEKQVLFGFIFISKVEYLEERQSTYFSCQPFCQNDELSSNTFSCGANAYFNFHQTIPIIYEEGFITKLRDNYMIFEFWEKKDQKNILIGICSIPLHQYYLAFRNPVIVKYLDRNTLPVIGTDWYEPISDPYSAVIAGQAQILVALGSNKQIQNLENERGFKDNIVKKVQNLVSGTKHNSNGNSKECNDDIFKKEITENKSTQKVDTFDKGSQSDSLLKQVSSTFNTEDILRTCLQFVSQRTEMTHVNMETNTDNNLLINLGDRTIESNCQGDLKKTTDLLDSLQNVLATENENLKKDLFKAHVVIDSALHLPSRKKCKARKIKGKFVREEILPSTYVTFETCNEGDVKSTQIVQKSTNPKWDYRCDVSLPLDLLINNKKRLLFKIWKKSNNASMQPNLQVDTVLGFAALDLTVLMAGLPTVEGWFNIVDLSSKCNGQIKINITPLERISKFAYKKAPFKRDINSTSAAPEEPGELLSRTLKRKFIELDEITHRLRTRLSHVTNDEETDTSNDEIADEFENDINTLCVEDDYDMIDFVREAQNLNLQRVSSSLMKWQGESIPDNETLLIYTDNEHVDLEDNASLGKFAPSLQVSRNKPQINLVTNNETFCNVENDLLLINSNSVLSNETICSNISNLNMIDPIKTQSNAGLLSVTNVKVLDKQLIEGKQRIDTLLQKLSLISKSDIQEPSDYSLINKDVHSDISSNAEEEILEELGVETQFDANKLFDDTLLELKDSFQTSTVESICSSIDSKERNASEGLGSNIESKKVVKHV